MATQAQLDQFNNYITAGQYDRAYALASGLGFSDDEIIDYVSNQYGVSPESVGALIGQYSQPEPDPYVANDVDDPETRNYTPPYVPDDVSDPETRNYYTQTTVTRPATNTYVPNDVSDPETRQFTASGGALANPTGSGTDWSSYLTPQVIAGLLGAGASVIPSQQTGTQKTESAPWAAQQPYLLDLFARAQKEAGAGNQYEIEALSSARDRAREQSKLMQPMITHVAGQAQTDPTKSPIWNNNIGYQQTGAAIKGLGSSNVGTNPFLGKMSSDFIKNTGATSVNRNPYIGKTIDPGANPLMGINNPYLNASIDAASRDAIRNMGSLFNQQNKASGSFGNTGLGEMQARTAAQMLGDISTNARMGDYINQQQLYEGDINRRLGSQQTDIARNLGAQQSYDFANAGYQDAYKNRLNASYADDINRNMQGYYQQNLANAQFGENALNRQAGAISADAQNKYQADLANMNRQSDLYNTGMNRNLAWAGQMPSLLAADWNNSNNWISGANQYGNLGWNDIKNYGAAVTGNYGALNTQPIYQNIGAELLGGAGSGLSIYNALKQPKGGS